MKRSFQILLYLSLAVLILTVSCTSSRKNELTYRYSSTENAISFDSLKSEILGSTGVEMFVVYPDSDIVIIHYDRFRTHQDVIETCFKECGYDITLVQKDRIEERDLPWKKK